MFFSASGNTKELVDIAPILKQHKLKTVSVCCKAKSKLADICDLNITTPFKREIGGNINKIPTNSIMSQLLFVNMLTSLLKSSIDLDQYKRNHTSGSIGKNLLKIKDLLIIAKRLQRIVSNTTGEKLKNSNPMFFEDVITLSNLIITKFGEHCEGNKDKNY